jgi:carbamoyl-phosphate synthase small subunit
VPHDFDFTDQAYDGLFISNGPGNPEDYVQTIAHIKKAIAIGKPIYGICLGSQLLALAAGAKTYKLKFGHRGHNQPCMNIEEKLCYITSQNHGYAVDEKSLPKDWKVTYRNLNDDSVEGIAHKTKPFYTVQFHPEACPGPTDTAFIFERFERVL